MSPKNMRKPLRAEGRASNPRLETGGKFLATIYADKIWYYSDGDKSRFFSGLYDNPAYLNVKGYGTKLHIKLDTRKLTRESLYDLVALFFRYKVDMKELKPLLNSRTIVWLELYMPEWLDLITGDLEDFRVMHESEKIKHSRYPLKQ
jgi:hypothetical protein